MSNGNWRILAALAGIAAIFCAAGFGAYYGSIYAPEKRHYQSIGPNSGQTYPSDSPRNGLADVSGIDSLTQSLVAKPQPRDSNDRQDRDLAAQESMAVFSYWMFGAMVLQTLLAGGALVALLTDLKQNRVSAEQQLRAYLVLHEFVWRTDKGDYFMQIEWVNKGQTPAYKADAIATWIDLDHPIPDDFDFALWKDPDEFGSSMVGPEQPIFATCSEQLTPELIGLAADGKRHIYLWGRATYYDAFGNSRFSECAVKVYAKRLENNIVIRWKALDRHNDAN